MPTIMSLKVEENFMEGFQPTPHTQNIVVPSVKKPESTINDNHDKKIFEKCEKDDCEWRTGKSLRAFHFFVQGSYRYKAQVTSATMYLCVLHEIFLSSAFRKDGHLAECCRGAFKVKTFFAKNSSHRKFSQQRLFRVWKALWTKMMGMSRAKWTSRWCVCTSLIKLNQQTFIVYFWLIS